MDQFDSEVLTVLNVPPEVNLAGWSVSELRVQLIQVIQNRVLYGSGYYQLFNILEVKGLFIITALLTKFLKELKP